MGRPSSQGNFGIKVHFVCEKCEIEEGQVNLFSLKIIFNFFKFRIFIICEQKIYVFNFISFENIDTIDTFENPKGIVAVSADSKITVLAYPDKTKGYVKVKSYDKSITALIHAHESPIAALALNSDGSLLATASDKVKLITKNK